MQNLNTTMGAKNNKIVLGMSGGVDSTAAALILRQRGYEVYGLYFDVFGNPDSEGWTKAQAAAGRAGVPVKYRDISKEFKREIIASFYNEYVTGRTPNPCIICNKVIKFRVLFEEADSIGADYVATGHYAGTCEKDGRKYIQMFGGDRKDQSYVLWKLGCDEIERIVFPLADFASKDEVREMLRSEGFDCAEDADSQEICFIENDDYVSFLTEKMGYRPVPGTFVDRDGTVLGEHPGIIRFTIGQRKGLGVTFGKPVFVTKIDGKTNEVTLGSNEDLFKTEVSASGCSFADGSFIGSGGELTGLRAKVRYAAPLSDCRIRDLGNGRVLTAFEKPQRAPTPGQSVVWYDGDRVIGGGIIDAGDNI